MRIPRREVFCAVAAVSFVVLGGAVARAQSGNESSKTEPANSENPERIRVYLTDGTVVTGELSVDEFTVATDYGDLSVPVTKIISITPGLRSHTTLAARIDKLIEQLGGDDQKVRDEAQKQLLAMGPPLSGVIAEYTNSKNAELKRRATEIVSQFSEQEGDDVDSDDKQPWTRQDVIVTPKFNIAGDISPSSFQLKSKYGPLNVSLSDIVRTERESDEDETIVKTVRVPGQKLIQRGMQSSRIRVNAGDTITVAASGQISMPPFGSTASSSPEGSTRYSYYYANVNGVRTKLYGGTLVARIGKNLDFVRVGSKARFRARKSGVLYFGVVMKDTYSRSNYYYGGEYKLRVKVEPK